ncbi:3'(2'),5'-bisphosphate nucleotidase CysQ [Tropicimonas sp. IMCC6043]|uniref:inositol monophosphatase family protein n=1 Tax=Tropicimonas sp. IMCC6043 TaxID=2510645 RepID=UPI00101BF007|nr:3'(2'),5'-bisphosphate nucleotidase CysQ [Tropicimonas sp. IMCC6043]RYH08683.1 3'(2'),5'-bisphosphate nucleotidase CysQ [Tropicimonas sp. IMCC6043]
MPESDLALLIEAAEAAGEIARRHFARRSPSWEKADGQGPVTEADLEVDAMLQERLMRARPDYGWLSEESGEGPDRRSRARIFVIDPIDGTRAFVDGQKTWSHSLAVVDGGKPVAAVVYLPMLGKLYTAAAGEGARFNGTPIAASPRQGFEGADILAAHPAFDARFWKGGSPDVKRHFRSSLAYRLALVGEGRFDGMLVLRDSWEWDIAAGALIAAESGARVSDRHGRPIAFNSAARLAAGVVCATPGVHAEILSRLRV